MINLTSTSDVLKVVTGSTLNVDVHASWVDLSSALVPTPGRTNTAISTATTTNVVPAPASSTYRNLKTLTVRNKDATSSQAITVQHFDGTTTIDLIKATLPAGSQLQYSEGDGWSVLDANGAVSVGTNTGRLLKTTVLTTGTAQTFTTGMQTNSIEVEMVGGGGGGGGCTSVASAAAAAGGGGAGGYARKLFAVSPNTGYTYTVGAAGAGVSGAAGADGTSSTFAVGATTVTAFLGSGGPQAVSTITIGTGYAGGSGGVVSTNGDVNGAGMPGEAGVMTTVGPLGRSGEGGSGPFGGGGKALVAANAGNNAAGFGAGGGGSMTGASSARAGGNGAGGVIIVREYS